MRRRVLRPRSTGYWLLPPLHDPWQLAWTVVSVWMEMAWIFFLNEHVKTVHL
jgi:hypothetical protein